jgi:hypothetical protein
MVSFSVYSWSDRLALAVTLGASETDWRNQCRNRSAL